MQESNINGKRILVVGMTFQGYYKIIVRELENLGASVTFVDSAWMPEDFRLSSSYLLTLIYYVKNPYFRRKLTNNIISKIRDERFDILFSFGMFTPKKIIIDHLKLINPELKSFVFFWDSFTTWNYSHTINWFDYSYSFDFEDCKKHNQLTQLDDFYVENELSQNIEKKWDICHIGSAGVKYNHRLKLLFRIWNDNHSLRINFRVLQPKISLVKKVIKSFTSLQFLIYLISLKKCRNFITQQKIPLDVVLEQESHSIAILDLPLQTQSGITIRTLTALKNKQKIITSNKYIKHTKFYHPNNVLIVDENNCTISKEFLELPFTENDVVIRNVKEWLVEIFKPLNNK